MQRSFLSLGRKSLEAISLKIWWSSAQHSLCQHRTISSLPEEETGKERLHRTNRDRLLLRGLIFQGNHGVYEEERKLGQKFKVDVDAWLDLRKAGETDALEDSVNYAEIYSRIKTIVEGPPYLLLESVATAIASDVLKHYPKISDVCVRIAKPHVAVEGVVDFLGIEIFRSASELTNNLKNINVRLDSTP